MAYSTCCGAHTTMPEIGICPDCKEHCDWEDDQDVDDERYANNQSTEGGIAFSTEVSNGR